MSSLTLHAFLSDLLPEVLDSVLDYPTWFALTSAFSLSSGNLSTLVATVRDAQQQYKNGELMTGSFLENHDQIRFAGLTHDEMVSHRFVISMH